MINKCLILNIKEEDINNIDLSDVYNNILSFNDIINICNSYVDFSVFRKEQYKIYEKLIKMKKLDEYTSHMKRNIINWNEDLIKLEVNKYNTLKDFYTYSSGCYIFICRNKQYKYLLSNFNI